ncbi:MAG: hypothetical protein DME93_12695 [Verrucomicrobia bacterium]|nr:MAG: hypothetical protein DME93_12695 [Verrucomicrobiota bacterium]
MFNFLFCFGLLWLPTVGGHFRPFTEVLRKIFECLTREVREFFEQPASAKATAGRQRMSRIQRWVLRQKETKTAKAPFVPAKESLCPLCCLLVAEKYHRGRNRQHTRARACRRRKNNQPPHSEA